MPIDATPSLNPRVATIAVMDALLADYVDGSRWTKGNQHDERGGQCTSGAARHIRRTHGIRGDWLRQIIDMR